LYFPLLLIAQKKQNASVAQTRSVLPQLPALHESELHPKNLDVKQPIRAVALVVGQQDEPLCETIENNLYYTSLLVFFSRWLRRTLLREEPLPGRLSGEFVRCLR